MTFPFLATSCSVGVRQLSRLLHTSLFSVLSTRRCDRSPFLHCARLFLRLGPGPGPGPGPGAWPPLGVRASTRTPAVASSPAARAGPPRGRRGHAGGAGLVLGLLARAFTSSLAAGLASGLGLALGSCFETLKAA